MSAFNLANLNLCQKISADCMQDPYIFHIKFGQSKMQYFFKKNSIIYKRQNKPLRKQRMQIYRNEIFEKLKRCFKNAGYYYYYWFPTIYSKILEIVLILSLIKLASEWCTSENVIQIDNLPNF